MLQLGRLSTQKMIIYCSNKQNSQNERHEQNMLLDATKGLKKIIMRFHTRVGLLHVVAQKKASYRYDLIQLI